MEYTVIIKQFNRESTSEKTIHALNFANAHDAVKNWINSLETSLNWRIIEIKEVK